MARKLVIVGARQIAEVCAFYLHHESKYKVSAFTVERASLSTTTFANRPVVPFEELVTSHPPSDYDLFVAVGPQKMNRTRSEKYDAAKAMGYTLPTYISSKA